MTRKEIEREYKKEEKEAGHESLLCCKYDDLCRIETPAERKIRIARKKGDPETAEAIRRAFCGGSTET